MDFDPHCPLSDEERLTVEACFNQESDFFAVEGYNDPHGARAHALFRMIQKYRTENFDPFIPYLAANYFDRYVSRHNLLQIKKDWMNDVDLLAITCLNLALKLSGTDFKRSEFLQDIHMGFQMEDVLKAEIQIRTGLDGKMRPITAFSFARYFFDSCRPPRGLQMETFCRIVYETLYENRFTGFKPSVISASALLVAFSYLYPERYHVYEDRLMRVINREELTTCIVLVKDMCDAKELWMETAEIDTYEDPPQRVRAGAQWRRPVVESFSSAKQHKKASLSSKKKSKHQKK